MRAFFYNELYASSLRERAGAPQFLSGRGYP